MNEKKLRNWEDLPRWEKIQILGEIKQAFLKEMEKREIAKKDENLEKILENLI